MNEGYMMQFVVKRRKKNEWLPSKGRNNGRTNDGTLTRGLGSKQREKERKEIKK
jgi:hypothetical protein